MVDLTDSSSPYQQSIPDLVFYIPAVVVFSLAGLFGYKLYTALMERERKRKEKVKQKHQRKNKKAN